MQGAVGSKLPTEPLSGGRGPGRLQGQREGPGLTGSATPGGMGSRRGGPPHTSPQDPTAPCCVRLLVVGPQGPVRPRVRAHCHQMDPRDAQLVIFRPP